MEKSNAPLKQPLKKDGKMADLPMRIVSGVTLLVLVLFAVYMGGYYFLTLLMGVIFLGAYEWAGLSGITPPAKRLGYGALVVAVLLYAQYDNVIAGFSHEVAPLIAIVFGALATMAHRFEKDTPNRFKRVSILLAIFGVFYLWVGGYVLAELRALSALHIYGLVAVLIGIDVGAYFCGRFLGGPKIWVALSPKKTWAGLLGAVLGVVAIMSIPIPMTIQGQTDLSLMTLMKLDADVMLALAVVVSVVAQGGDFLESWMKRRVGVKDSSNLIPGHGGFLDRMDGYLSVLVVMAIFAF